jgi:hypothetical protein
VEKFMAYHPKRIAIVLLTLSLLCACSRPPAGNAANPSDPQKLPFDRTPSSNGISPSQSLIPSATKLPEGTPIPIRLRSALSSASSHAGDTFNATVDEAVAIDGQTLIAPGTPAIGRVLEARRSASSSASSRDGSLGHSLDHPLEPGYLRIVLVSLNLGGKQVTIETSSIFVKGSFRAERKPATEASSSAKQKDSGKEKNGDIVLGKDRRFSFRLAQGADLQ